ncbi:cilia- and flagella-associated protein 47-like [Frieseomelitta varia]|uniref:cilia- and flagella-associated protein 47-like n=1 Tax=Frieseomelitta varia TaxID=561572 RepID=UPI001CB67B96|nr:cilia- and flagella-associated protein 47-like [Frieseomelitta varia]
MLMQEGIDIQYIPSSIDQSVTAQLDDVHIYPRFIEFNEASEGITCQRRITIKNTGKKPAFIKVHQAKSISFQVKSLDKGVILNPGLNISTVVTYSFRRPSLLSTVIPIEVNGKILDYRVICKLLNEGIDVEPKSIDFGIVDIGYSSGIKVITLKNKGGQSTRFSIDLGTNDLEITVQPMRGIVKPNKPVQLTVELIGMNEGSFFCEFWIKSVPNIRIPFNVKVIVPKLVIYHPNATGDFTLIDFSGTVVNTRKYDSFVLRNISSQVASYVVLGEIDNELVCVRNINRKKYPVYRVFKIRPIQGRIGPFEGIIFEVGFTPMESSMQWRETVGKKSSGRERDLMAFLRIVRVHVTETKHILRANESIRDELMEALQPVDNLRRTLPIIDDWSSSSSTVSTVDSGPNDTVRLCLYGEMESARLNFQPDTIYFGELRVGEDSRRVLRISNPLKFVPLLCTYVRNASTSCCPETMTLRPEGSVEVLLKVRGKENVDPSFEIYFDAAASSCESTITRRRTMIKVGRYAVQCRVNVKLVTSIKGTCLSRGRSTFDAWKTPSPQLFPIKPRTVESKKKMVVIKCKDDEEEILQRVTHIPKWKYKNVSETVKCATTLDKKISALTTSTSVLIPLSPLQIYNIRMYPILFAFGMVVPRSRNYKQLVVENLNDFPIMIRLTSLSARRIHFPEGNLIILPPGLHATRLVEFRAHHVGKFNGYIDYIINDNHSFELAVTANIVEKQLSLDTREIVLGRDLFNEEIYQPMDYVVQVRNKLDARTNFRWEVPSTCCFFVEPMSGVVRGKASLFTYIYYKPDFTRSSSTELIMKCENNSYSNLRVSLLPQTPKVNFIKNLINVGEIPLNLPTKTVAFLRNFEHIEIEFEVDASSLIHGCNVQPLHGVLAPRGIVVLEIHLTFSLCFQFTVAIRVTVQKRLNVQLKLTGNVAFPQLKLHPSSINLRRLSASAYKHCLITASNVGSTMLKLRFQLKEYPEFRVSLSSRRQDPGIGNEDISIAPNTSQDFYLHIEPVDLATYAFYLPIVVNDILGPALITSHKSLKPLEYLKQFKSHYADVPNLIMRKLPSAIVTMPIDCTVTGHLLFFNKFEFRFNFLTNNQSDQFCIENRESLEERFVRIDTSSFSTASCPFSIQWLDGREPIVTSDHVQCALRKGERCRFLLTFRPKFQGNFIVEAPIFIRDESNGEMFNKLCLIGERPASTIEAEFSEIFFTPVPLNTSLEKKFRLYVRHFENDAVISAKTLSPEYCSGKFTTDNVLLVHFVDTNVVHASEYTELEVRVAFKSGAPVSLRVIVEFSDDNGIAVSPVAIHATSENCLLTTHAYVRNSMIDLKQSSIDRRTPRVSRTSEIFTDDEDYNVDILKPDLSKIGVLTYFGRKSQISDEKLIEDRFKFYESLDERANVDKPERETKKYLPDISKRDSKVPATVSKTKYEDAQESLRYPFFPFNIDDDEFEIYINQTLKAAEEWMHSEAFKFNFYADVTCIKMVLSKYYSKKPAQFKTTTRKGPELGFVGVLESLIGPTIYEHIGQFKELPEKDIDRVNYICNLYDSILQFLTKHGAHLCHVQPQFLLDYEEYIVFLETIYSRSKPYTYIRKSGIELSVQEKMSPLKFEHRSKQCWLDVILQTYKCFILPCVSEIKDKEDPSPMFSSQSSRRSTIQRASVIFFPSSFRKQYEAHNVIVDNINIEISSKPPDDNYSFDELFLLEWLHHHYEKERKQEWMIDRRVILNPNESRDVAEARKIENFDRDLSDSLVLIAVTAAYCPFLIDEYLSKLYIRPRSYEEALHNAVCVTNAWRKIRLGFVISPLEIVYPNCVKMLMLVGYLFDILPTYTPKGKIKFNCPLSETVTRQLNFTNPTVHNVGFLILFFGNNNGFFALPSSQMIINLSGRENSTIKIQFHARKIKKTKAYLLFCGSTIGPHFGRNQTFILEGQADCLEIANEYTICSKLYKAVDKTLTINVPYKDSTEYEIWVSDERPSKPSILKQTRWCELCLRKIPRRLFLNQNSIIVKGSTKVAHLSVTVACLSPSHRSFWIIFQSKIGDFIIQINSQWQSSLTDNIVVNWDEQIEKCVCTEQDYNEICPLSLTVPIPSKNKQLWRCVAHMFQKTLDPKERLFWSRYLDTPIGLRLIRWLMGDNADSAVAEFCHIFDATVTYNVTISEMPHILRFPKTFTINDVRSAENVPMKIHVSPFVDRLCEIILTLVSANGTEQRVYKVCFLRERE